MNRKSWRLSSSHLRMCLKIFSAHKLQAMVYAGQFQWLELEGSWYLYNSRSRLILATVRVRDGKTLIRYRPKSRYKHIIQKWIESQEAISFESTHVGRWERRMNYIRMRGNTDREMVLRLYARNLLPKNLEVLKDGITGMRVLLANNRNSRNSGDILRDRINQAVAIEWGDQVPWNTGETSDR